jgi:endonuclease/exonuclease/phosphatase family metal-dependent hydrolase
MPEDYIVCRIASMQFPGVYLQMDGYDVTSSDAGQGNLTIGHGAGPLDQFKISAKPTSGPYVTAFESVAYPGVFLRMDATELNRDPRSGGKVNKQFGQAYYELFTIKPQSDGTVAIESVPFPGVYLRLLKGRDPGPTAVVNCHFGVGESERFRFETPPAVPRLRVLSYNTHLMDGSFIHQGIDIKRLVSRMPYDIWDDPQRRDLILRNIVNSLADIVALQEIWAPQLLARLVDQLKPFYPYTFVGDEMELEVEGYPSIGTATSGLLLCSKFKLTDRSFYRFPGMEDWDRFSNKGVLGAVANLPDKRKLRIVTAHTTGEVRDIQFMADRIKDASEFRALPMITLGDFNISWEKGGVNEKYNAMKQIFAGINVVTDSWIDVHGEAIEPDPYTVKMRQNTLHQLFSPERDTEKDTRLDYLWVKPGAAAAWVPTTVSVPRGEDWLYESPQWHWAHKNVVQRMASAAALGDVLLVLSRGVNYSVMGALFDGNTSKWSHYDTGFKTSAPPGVVAFQNKFHLFHQHDDGNAIFHRSSADGRTWSNWENVGINTGGSCCPVVFDGKLHLLYVDPDGRGGQIFCSVKDGSANFEPRNWEARKGIGINTQSDISAAVFNNKLYVVCKDYGSMDLKRSGLMWSILENPGENWKPSQADKNLETSGSPGVVAFQNSLHVYYKDPNEGDAIFHAAYDGQKWTEKNKSTLHDSMVYGVCPIVFANKLWLFYSYHSKTPGGYYPNGVMLHAQIPTVKVDLSDHYPLMVELEPAMANILVDERGIGDVIFHEGEWAGTLGKSIPIDGFQLSSGRPDFKFRYKAHLQGSGDTQWKNDGEYIGTRGESRAVEGFTIELTGPGASSYKLSYRAHVQNQGDTAFVEEGYFCGTTRLGRAIEAIYLRLGRK